MAQNQNYTGEKKHGKKKLLLLLLFGFLGLGGLGGGTVGVLYGVGVFKPNAITKITLSKAFFDNESTTTLTLTTPYAINDTVNEKTILSSLAGWINQAGRQAYYFENQLTVSNIGTSPGDNTALLKTKTNSVNYSSSTLTIAYQIVQQRNLTADLNQLSMPIDRQNNWTSQPTAAAFLNDVKNQWVNNTTLDINEINVNMSSASWNAATDIYGVNDLGAYQVVITTKADSQIYIGGQTATLTYRIKRADLSSILSNNIGAIWVTPESAEEAAMLLCDANNTTVDAIQAQGGGTLNVTVSGSNVTAYINGSSFYASTSFTRSFTLPTMSSLRDSNHFNAATGNFFGTNTGNSFNEMPNRLDIISSWARGEPSWGFTLVWSDINMTFATVTPAGNGTVTFAPLTGSLTYTNVNVVLSFTYYVA